MSLAEVFSDLVTRQSAAAGTEVSCDTSNQYDGRIGLRVAAIFVIWFGSSVGSVFPIFAKRHQVVWVPKWSFFIAKYFGSGVIVATAFIHLLAPAYDAITNPCLTGPITQYPWVAGMVLMTIFAMFFIELMVIRYARFGGDAHAHESGQKYSDEGSGEGHELRVERGDAIIDAKPGTVSADTTELKASDSAHIPGEDHLGHQREHRDIDQFGGIHNTEDYASQLTGIFILEFGIIFHSIFIGLTLAVSGKEFNTLFTVLLFHQTFEGLGLGSRLATIPWPASKRWTPYILGLAYGFSTPIAIAAGLGVRETYAPGSATTLVVNGVFDSISAGILIYTGLVELMAHEFMFSSSMRQASIKILLAAFGLMCLGAGLMALLGKWA